MKFIAQVSAVAALLVLVVAALAAEQPVNLEDEVRRAQGAIVELTQQRDFAMNRAAQLAAELALERSKQQKKDTDKEKTDGR